MSSIEDRLREFEETLPPHHKQHIADLLSEIRSEMDKVIQGEERIDYLIGRLISVCDEIGLSPEMNSMYIKRKLKGIVSDDIIERHLPEERKRKHKPYERYQDTEIRSADFQEPVTVASDGSESYTKPDGSEGEREREEIEEITELFKEKERKLDNLENIITGELDETRIRLNEALALCDDKDKRIYNLELERGEFEIRIGELKKRLEDKKPSAVNQKQVDTIEELTIERDNLKMALQEMKDIERARIKESGFTTASKMPKQAWIQASNSLDFYIALNKAAKIARDRDMDFLKILFTVAEDGQLGYAYLEGEEFQL